MAAINPEASSNPAEFRMGDQGHWAPVFLDEGTPVGCFLGGNPLWTEYGGSVWAGDSWKRRAPVQEIRS